MKNLHLSSWDYYNSIISYINFNRIIFSSYFYQWSNQWMQSLDEHRSKLLPFDWYVFQLRNILDNWGSKKLWTVKIQANSLSFSLFYSLSTINTRVIGPFFSNIIISHFSKNWKLVFKLAKRGGEGGNSIHPSIQIRSMDTVNSSANSN